MTPDHTPFLRPGTDLITAEDVRVWLRDEADNAPARNRRPPATVLYDTLARLTARLDRERVRACRRVALEMWRSGSRHHRKWPHRCQHCRNRLLEALAFRAAAARGGR